MGVRAEQDKKLRAIELIGRTVVKGETIKSVAKDMGISEDTAQRTLKWARDANVLREYEYRLYSELLPLAHEAVKLALQDGDAQVALKIMESAGLGPNRLKGNSKAAQEYEEGLYGELAKQRDGWVIDVTPERRALTGDIIDVGPDDAGAESAGDAVDDVSVRPEVGGADGDPKGPEAEV